MLPIVLTLLLASINLIYNPKQDTIINYQQTTITVKHGAIALIDVSRSADANSISIYNLYQQSPKQIIISTTIENDNLQYVIAPGRFISIGDHKTNMPIIQKCNLHLLCDSILIGNFVISSALLTVPQIYQADNNITNKICQSIAMLETEETTLAVLNAHIPILKHPSGKL